MNVDRLAIDDGAAGRRFAVDRKYSDLAYLLRRQSLRHDLPQLVTLGEIDRRRRSVAKLNGSLGDRIQHRLHVGRRARDHAQDFADRRLLLERVLELARALVDLALQAGIGFAQLRRHAVELVGESLQLVAGAHLDLLVEIARADAPRAFVEGVRIGRTMPRARRDRADGGRESEPASSSPGAQDRRVQRGVNLRDRLLDEHLPVAADRSGRPTVSTSLPGQIGRQPSPASTASAGERGLHVIGGCDEIGLCAARGRCPGSAIEEAVAVDDVRLALVADLDARDHVPDELQVDLGHRHGPLSRRPSGSRSSCTARSPCGSTTGPNQVLPRWRVLKRGLLRTVLARLPATSIAEARRQRSARGPRHRVCAMSVTSGAWRRSLRNSMRRSFDVAPRRAAAAPHTTSCCSIWRMNCSIRDCGSDRLFVLQH